ncbi:MAG: malate/lactate/ureidoglycolate dehydrogenase [Negativicutes bacterium]|nr:malate/lactate/ureidoglycolate dehydrogenase [Negativicutes bacterium]
MAERFIAKEALVELGTQIFITAGVSKEESRRVSENLVEANLYGHDSHGIGLVPKYIEDLKGKQLFPDRKIKILKDTGSMISVDGQLGFGQSIGIEAMNIGIERAKQYGVAMVGTARSHHLARIGHWGDQCAAAGMASIHFVNVVAPPKVAPWRGSDARLVTNPICITVPNDPYPIQLDFATSAVAFGKVQVAYEAQKAMKQGSLIDSQGLPTNDPAVMFEEPKGAMMAFGEHKGYGLAFMCEVLGAALFAGDVQDKVPPGNPLTNNMLSIIFKPYELNGKDALQEQIHSVMEWIKGSSQANPNEPILFPGDIEQITFKERLDKGIPLSEGTISELLKCATQLGIQNPENMI